MIESVCEKEFFILTSDNLDEMQSHLYGFCVEDNEVVTFNDEENVKVSGVGSYVYLKRDSDNLTVYQDFIGSYGLYLYENEDFFAISNSFLRLEEFIRERFEISLNEDYAKSFIVSDTVSFSFDETLINEICLIPKDYSVVINLKTKKLSFKEVDYGFDSLELDSEESLRVLDGWFDKWTAIIRNLKKRTNDLSFVFDDEYASLALMSLILNSNINPDKIRIKNLLHGDNVGNISKICEDYNLNLNNDTLLSEEIVEDMELSLEKSFCVKLGFSKKMNLKNATYKNTTYTITDTNIETLQNQKNHNTSNLTDKFTQTTEEHHQKNMQKIQKHTKTYDTTSPQFNKTLQIETTIPKQIGKSNVESYLKNNITLNPLLDPQLLKIRTYTKNEKHTKRLMLLIISRYTPGLLEYMEPNKEDQEKTMQINKKLNYEKRELKPVHDPEEKEKTQKQTTKATNEIEELLTKTFFTTPFKHTFLKYYPEEIYDQISRKYHENNKTSIQDITGIIALIKTINDIEYNKNKFNKTELDWLKTFICIDNFEETTQNQKKYMLEKYSTARIDLKNQDTYTNQIKILEISDTKAQISTPQWFTNEKGVGVTINSNNSSLKIKIKCINNGDLKIELRTLDKKDRNGTRFPIYMDYLSFKMDGKEYLKENTLAHHDKPITITKKVLDNEIINIETKWQPFTRISKYK